MFSAVFAAAGDPALVGVARFGQGAAASAFSPAAGALVARLNPQARQGRAFGGYGLYKSLTAGFGALAAALMACAALIAPRNRKSPPLPGPRPGRCGPRKPAFPGQRGGPIR